MTFTQFLHEHLVWLSAMLILVIYMLGTLLDTILGNAFKLKRIELGLKEQELNLKAKELDLKYTEEEDE